MYFSLASLLFLLSCYQVNLAGNVLEKQSRMMPAHLEGAFSAGCKQIKKTGCKDAASKFRKEQEKIYN